jgi:hypothetical protein
MVDQLHAQRPQARARFSWYTFWRGFFRALR